MYLIDSLSAASMMQDVTAPSLNQQATALATVADAMPTRLLGPNLAWPLSYGLLDARDVLAVDDAAIEAALRLTASELKQAVEPAGAVALAGLLSPAFAALRDDPERPLRRVAAVVCGGNVDAGTLAAILAGGGD